jgi:hypothetical protein
MATIKNAKNVTPTIYIFIFFKLNIGNKQLFEIKISKSKLGFSKWTKINVQI